MIDLHRCRLLLSTLMLLAVSLQGRAQAPDPAPPPGLDPNIQRENTLRDERYFNPLQAPPEQTPDEVVIEGPGSGAEGLLPESDSVFELSSIVFNDSSFLASATLQGIADAYTGRPIRFADLNAMVGEINAIYAERGIISARAIIPAQTVDNGSLRVRLVEGRLGALEVQGTTAIKADFISNRVAMIQGEVVDVPALREALNRINRTTELQVQSTLRAGASPGATDVVLHVQEPRRLSAQAFIDNLGTEATGENRFGTIIQYYAPLGMDDRFTFYAVGGDGATNVFLGYGLPVTRSGGRLDLSYSQGDIEIVEGAFVDLDIAGESSSVDLSYTQPFLRGNRFWLDAYGSLSSSESTTDASDRALSEFTVSRYSLGLRLQGFGARSVWTLRQGIGSADVDNIFGEGTEVMIYDGSADYTYRFNPRWSASAGGSWQFTDEETAPSPVLFQVGGISSVRGYDNGLVAGARGYFLNLETRYRWNERLLPFAFIDAGHVDDISPDKETITSIGLGLSWQYGRHFSGEFSYAHAMDTIVPDQEGGRLHLRFSVAL